MSIVYIGIGSNLGDRKANCMRAIELLAGKGIVVRKESSLYETDPWGDKNQPNFLNMAIEIETELKPRDLLGILAGIEKKLGRKKEDLEKTEIRKNCREYAADFINIQREEFKRLGVLAE